MFYIEETIQAHLNLAGPGKFKIEGPNTEPDGSYFLIDLDGDVYAIILPDEFTEGDELAARSAVADALYYATTGQGPSGN